MNQGVGICGRLCTLAKGHNFCWYRREETSQVLNVEGNPLTSLMNGNCGGVTVWEACLWSDETEEMRSWGVPNVADLASIPHHHFLPDFFLLLLLHTQVLYCRSMCFFRRRRPVLYDGFDLLLLSMFEFAVGSVGQISRCGTLGLLVHINICKYPFRYPTVADEVHILCISHFSVAKG